MDDSSHRMKDVCKKEWISQTQVYNYCLFVSKKQRRILV